MTYADKFVAEVKQGGKILRVKDGAVFLPFGSEYSILLKNLNSKRASVKVSIDGEDVLDNHSLVLDVNASTELQGFLRGNVARNRFRFINKTKEISEHRGDRADDGLIRIEFAFEKPKEQPWITNTIKEVHHHFNQPLGKFEHYGSSADWRYTNDDNSGRGVGPQTAYTNCASDSLTNKMRLISLSTLSASSLNLMVEAEKVLSIVLPLSSNK